MSLTFPVQFDVEAEDQGTRFDVFLVKQLPDVSRAAIGRAIKASHILLNGRSAKASYKLRGGEQVTVTQLDVDRDQPQAEDIPLDVLYEDDHLVVINKPHSMVVHPAKGHWSGTLVSALAFRFQQLSQVGGATRPGIVHRLDRDTSGVIVVARNDQAHLHLASQFEQRTVKKQYFAIVAGIPDRDRDIIEQPIGAHPYQREKMAIRANHSTSRDAKTYYEVGHRFRRFATVNVFPQTGRTHQIRVHLAHIRCPVLCDRLYGGRSMITAGELESGKMDDRVLLERQALHAASLEFDHPATGERMKIEAPMPSELQAVLEVLEQ